MNSRSVLLVIIVGVATSVIIEIVCEKPILTQSRDESYTIMK